MQEDHDLMQDGSVIVLKSKPRLSEFCSLENLSLFSMAILFQLFLLVLLENQFSDFFTNILQSILTLGDSYISTFMAIVIVFIRILSLVWGAIFLAKSWCSLIEFKKGFCAIEKPLILFIVGVFLYAFPFILESSKNVMFSSVS